MWLAIYCHETIKCQISTKQQTEWLYWWNSGTKLDILVGTKDHKHIFEQVWHVYNFSCGAVVPVEPVVFGGVVGTCTPPFFECMNSLKTDSVIPIFMWRHWCNVSYSLGACVLDCRIALEVACYFHLFRSSQCSALACCCPLAWVFWVKSQVNGVSLLCTRTLSPVIFNTWSEWIEFLLSVLLTFDWPHAANSLALTHERGLFI